MRATILPAGVGMSPPIASCMRPNSTSRILLTAGIVRLLRKLRATISRSDENSNGVKSDFLGINCMGSPDNDLLDVRNRGAQFPRSIYRRTLCVIRNEDVGNEARMRHEASYRHVKHVDERSRGGLLSPPRSASYAFVAEETAGAGFGAASGRETTIGSAAAGATSG